MPVAPSFADLLAQYEAEALEARSTLQFLEGDVTTALEHGTGAMADAVLRYAVQALRDTFIDGAKADALTALVDDHLNIQRLDATAATTVCTFTRTSGGAGGTLNSGFVVATQFDSTGNTVLFTTDANVTFTGGDNGPHTSPVTAQLVGRQGNIGAAQITRVVDVPFDTTIHVTNVSGAGGGNDAEEDPDVRVRARNFWQTLRRGTLGALEFGALRVAAVRIARATEDPITGITTLVVTDSDGNSTAKMVADVITEVQNWRAAGSIVTVIGGFPLVVNVIGQLVAKSGVDTSVLGPLSGAAISGRMKKLRQGETLFIDSIKTAAISVDPDALEALILTTPLADVVSAPGQVIRPGTITIV